MTDVDETDPTTRTRPYKVFSVVGIGATIVFAVLSILLLAGVIFGAPSVKAVADSLFPWALLALAIVGITALFIVNSPSGRREEDAAE